MCRIDWFPIKGMGMRLAIYIQLLIVYILRNMNLWINYELMDRWVNEDIYMYIHIEG